MYRRTEPDPAERRAAADYRFALITRDYRRLRPDTESRWERRGRSVRRSDHQG
jgi:hypothetical protein